jgi:Mg2+ and Co2+ transporter CorA
MSKLTTEFKEEFINTKMQCDVLEQSIRLAKLNGADDKAVQPLIRMKQSAKEVFNESSAQLMANMQLSTNIVHLKDSWYAVRYVNHRADICIKVVPLNQKDLPILQRDGRKERELCEQDIDNLLPGCMDEAYMDLYNQTLNKRAREYLYDHLGMEIEDEQRDRITISAHAGKRWVQRKLDIKGDTQAEEYRRTHFKEIEEAILESFGKAELVWSGDDQIDYYFDSENIMYIVGNNTIITLYEEDFGFTKEINRMIVYKQLEVLREAYKEVEEAERQYADAIQGIDEEVQAITDEIAVLESKIEVLLARRSALYANMEQSNKQVKLARDSFMAEFNKLFKKWET